MQELKQLIENHLRYTGSITAKTILDNWKNEVSHFVKVMPVDYKRALAEAANNESQQETAVTN